MFDAIKEVWRKTILPSIDLKDLGKEALEALAFVLLDKAEEIAVLIGSGTLVAAIKKAKEAADMIDGEKDRT